MGGANVVEQGREGERGARERCVLGRELLLEDGGGCGPLVLHFMLPDTGAPALGRHSPK